MRVSVFLILFFSSIFAQNKIYYHKLRLTDSSPVVEKWDVKDKSVLGNNYVIEKVDSLNRVIELRFIENGKLSDESCYVTPIIRYEYSDDTIIAYFFKNEKEYIIDVECGGSQKTIFYLKNSKIEECVDYILDISFLNSLDTTNAENKNYYNYVKEYEKGKVGDCYGIFGYPYSIKKCNGKDPKKE